MYEHKLEGLFGTFHQDVWGRREPAEGVGSLPLVAEVPLPRALDSSPGGLSHALESPAELCSASRGVQASAGLVSRGQLLAPPQPWGSGSRLTLH